MLASICIKIIFNFLLFYLHYIGKIILLLKQKMNKFDYVIFICVYESKRKFNNLISDLLIYYISYSIFY